VQKQALTKNNARSPSRKDLLRFSGASYRSSHNGRKPHTWSKVRRKRSGEPLHETKRINQCSCLNTIFSRSISSVACVVASQRMSLLFALHVEHGSRYPGRAKAMGHKPLLLFLQLFCLPSLPTIILLLLSFSSMFWGCMG
jgi:hypothetical protein